jgi:hypothetical protein
MFGVECLLLKKRKRTGSEMGGGKRKREREG